MQRVDEVLAMALCTLDIAVLERKAPWEYHLLGCVPEFYLEYFMQTGVGREEPWQNSPMLECFFDEAESFFSQGQSGSLSSGVWQEDGKTLDDSALLATAIATAETRIVVIRLLKDDYSDRLSILRKAREQLLETRSLSVNLEDFKERSQRDGLTRLFNKNTFLELMGMELARSCEFNYPVSLIVLDIDDFKQANDRYGHLIGDKILASLGDMLIHSFRRNDILGRFGGEEFVALLPNEGGEQLLPIAEKLCNNIAANKVEGLPPITVSIGCSVFKPGESVDSLFDRADKALYKAKNAGKNTAFFCD